MRSSRHRRYLVGVSGQAVERPGLAQRLRCLVPFSPLRFLCQCRRDVVVEDVVVLARLVAGVRPPVCEQLAGGRDHAGHEDEKVGGDACADERRREGAERMADHDDVLPFAQRVDDDVDVLAPSCRLVLAGQIDGYRVVASLSQLRNDEVPVPCAPAATVDQSERRHLPANL